MDAYNVIAMFDDANATLSQQRTIKQDLRRYFGNKLFIPDYKIRNDVSHNLSMPKYGNMEYLSEKAKLENNLAESIDHWCYDVVDHICETAERDVDSKGNAHGLVA
jgi:hypothetical protein